MNINIQQSIADVFNNCFLTIADDITNKNINNDTFMPFKSQAFTKKYPYMSSKPTTTKETENIKLLNQKIQRDDEISTEILKLSSHFISSP